MVNVSVVPNNLPVTQLCLNIIVFILIFMYNIY